MTDEDYLKNDSRELMAYLNENKLLPGFYWFRWKPSALIQAMGAERLESMTGKGARWVFKLDTRAWIWVIGMEGPFYPGPKMLMLLKDIDIEGRIEEPK